LPPARLGGDPRGRPSSGGAAPAATQPGDPDRDSTGIGDSVQQAITAYRGQPLAGILLRLLVMPFTMHTDPRFVGGRLVRGYEYLNAQRRRYVLISKWAEYMKDLDMFIGAPGADVAPNAQTGHPCAVVQYKFDVPQQGGCGRGGAATPPPPPLNPQPICAVIVAARFGPPEVT